MDFIHPLTISPINPVNYLHAMNITNKDKEYMAEAIKLSERSVESGGGPFGTIIVKDGKIIASGSNQVTTSNDPTAHGEIIAIRKACKALNSFQLKGCSIYTSTEPCPMCLGAIYWARPDRVYFGNTKEDASEINFDDSFIYKEIEIPKDERAIPFFQLMREEAQKAFKMWTEKEDKIEY